MRESVDVSRVAKYPIVIGGFRPINHGIVLDYATMANLGRRPDGGMPLDDTVIGQFRIGFYDRDRMDARHRIWQCPLSTTGCEGSRLRMFVIETM
jgi:hypothetical protein